MSDIKFSCKHNIGDHVWVVSDPLNPKQQVTEALVWGVGYSLKIDGSFSLVYEYCNLHKEWGGYCTEERMFATEEEAREKLLKQLENVKT